MAAHTCRWMRYHPVTCNNSINNLRLQVDGHVQVGLLLADHAKPQIPMAKVIGAEIAAATACRLWRYQPMLDMIQTGKLKPELLDRPHAVAGRSTDRSDGDGQVRGDRHRRRDASLKVPAVAISR